MHPAGEQCLVMHNRGAIELEKDGRKGGFMDTGTRRTGFLLVLLAVVLVGAACAPTEEQGQSAGDAEIPDEVLIGATLPLPVRRLMSGGISRKATSWLSSRSTTPVGCSSATKKSR